MQPPLKALNCAQAHTKSTMFDQVNVSNTYQKPRFDDRDKEMLSFGTFGGTRAEPLNSLFHYKHLRESILFHWLHGLGAMNKQLCRKI